MKLPRLLFIIAALVSSAIAQTAGVTKSVAPATLNQITGDLVFPAGKTLTLNGTVSGTPAGGTLDLSAVTLTPPSNVVTLTGSQTLTNKTLTSPTLTTPNIGAATGTSVNLSGAGTFGGNLTVSGTSALNGTVNTNGSKAVNVTPTMTPLSGNLYGLYIQPTINSGASAGGTVSGLTVAATNSGTSNVTNIAGVEFIGGNGAASGSMQDLKAFRSSPINLSTGQIVNLYQFYATNAYNPSGTINTQYGLYVDALTSATTNYAIYTAGTAPSVLGGNLTVSGTGAFGSEVSANQASNPVFRLKEGGTAIASLQTYLGDLYIGIDGATNKDIIFRRNSGTETLRIAGSNGLVTLAGNLTVSGTGGITSSSISPLFKATSSALGSAPKLTLENTNLGAWNVYLSGTDGGDFKIDQDSTNKFRIAYGTGNATLAGNITVSGTGTSSVAGKLAVGITSTSSVIEGYTASAISGADGLTNLRLSYKGGPSAGDGGAQITFAQQYTGAQPDTLIRVGGVRGVKTAGSGSFGGGVQLLYQTAAAVDMSVGATLNSNGNLLLGTTTDSGNGKLQLATGAADKTSGIGFSSDTSLYRYQGGRIALDHLGGSLPVFSFLTNGTTRFSVYANGTTGTLETSNGSIQLATSGAIALTLDTSQNATFAGAATVSSTTASTSTTTGALKVAGGVGVAGNIYSGGAMIASGTSTSTGYNNNKNVQLEGPSGRAIINHDNGTASGTLFAGFGYNGSGLGSITQDGTSGVLYNTTSDARLKENVRDVTNSGAIIDGLKPRVFDWKKDGDKDRFGFLAQEVHAVFPQAVKKGDDGEEVTDAWAMDAAKLVPVLVAELKALRARVAALEAAQVSKP